MLIESPRIQQLQIKFIISIITTWNHTENEIRNNRVSKCYFVQSQCKSLAQYGPRWRSVQKGTIYNNDEKKSLHTNRPGNKKACIDHLKSLIFDMIKGIVWEKYIVIADASRSKFNQKICCPNQGNTYRKTNNI